MHAITIPHDPIVLKTSSYSTAAFYIACGIDPQEVFIFLYFLNYLQKYK